MAALSEPVGKNEQIVAVSTQGGLQNQVEIELGYGWLVRGQGGEIGIILSQNFLSRGF